MKKANSIVTTAFSALLATQATQALSQETRDLAEPFRSDVSSLLIPHTGDLIYVDNPTQLAERYVPGSSIVVEGDFGLTQRVLQELQREINETYAHLNILVYLAQDGRSFDEYNGRRISSSDLCGTNPGLAYLRDSFYQGTDQASEGNHIIFYLAAREPGYEYNMVCTLISPQMAELIGSDEQIFRQGQPVYDNVFRELKQDFNKLGAIQTFLREIDARVQDALQEQEQERREHIAQILSLHTELEGYRESVRSLVSSANQDITTSILYTSFASQYSDLDTRLSQEAQYISRSQIQDIKVDIEDLRKLHGDIVAAMTGFTQAQSRLEGFRVFIGEQRQGEYSDELEEYINNLEVSIALTQSKLDVGNIDYITDLHQAEERYQEILSAITRKRIQSALLDIIKWGSALSFMGGLIYMNRRVRRIDSKKEFLAHIDKLESGIAEMKRVFTEEIEGNTESIEIFFGDQTGLTAEKIGELKMNVAYISVLIPKIEEIIAGARRSVGISSHFLVGPFEDAVSMLTTDTHVLDPDNSKADRDLLDKINGGVIQEFSELIESMTQTLPELIKRLDANISQAKDIFDELESASTDSEREFGVYTQSENQLGVSMERLIQALGDEFGVLLPLKEKILQQLRSIVEDNSGADILGEFHEVSELNIFMREFISVLGELEDYIMQNTPSKYRQGLQDNGYDTSEFFSDILSRYELLFQKVVHLLERRVFATENPSDELASIYDFYQEMEELLQNHRELVSCREKKEGLVQLRNTSGATIRSTLGDRLGVSHLFEEEGININHLLEDIQSSLERVGISIQARDKNMAADVLRQVSQSLEKGHSIITRSQAIALGYDSDVAKLNRVGEQLRENLDGVSEKIQKLQQRFSPAVLLLRREDFKAEGTDENISNNREEIEGFFNQIEEYITESEQALGNGEFFKVEQLLQVILQLLHDIEARIREVEYVFTHVNQSHEGNTTKLETASQSIFLLADRVQSGARLTPNTLQNVILLQEQLRQVQEESRGNFPNPYTIEESLVLLNSNLERVSGELARDQAEYKEFNEYSQLAELTLTRFRNFAAEVANDRNPDSYTAKRVISSVTQIAELLQETLGEGEKKVVDWYILTDKLEGIIEQCERGIHTLQGEEKKREAALHKIESAKNQIRKAKNWSGRYTSISGTIGESELRSAHNAFQDGDFDGVLNLAAKAASIAVNAISDADQEEKRIKRKKQKEAEDRRRRQSYSSSSSSFGGGSLFGGGGGGFTGFSGGGGF